MFFELHKTSVLDKFGARLCQGSVTGATSKAGVGTNGMPEGEFVSKV